MPNDFDLIIIGAGPAGIFTALELADTGMSILILEKGLDIRERIALNKNRQAKAADRIAYDLVTKHFGPGFNGPLVVTADIIDGAFVRAGGNGGEERFGTAAAA